MTSSNIILINSEESSEAPAATKKQFVHPGMEDFSSTKVAYKIKVVISDDKNYQKNNIKNRKKRNVKINQKR